MGNDTEIYELSLPRNVIGKYSSGRWHGSHSELSSVTAAVVMVDVFDFDLPKLIFSLSSWLSSLEEFSRSCPIVLSVEVSSGCLLLFARDFASSGGTVRSSCCT